MCAALCSVSFGDRVITSNKTVLLDETPTLHCAVETGKDVVSISWQTIGPESVNVATYSKQYGVNVQPAFKDKVDLSSHDLKSSSLTILASAGPKDDGTCYKCLFNVYPTGAVSGQPCVNVLSPPVMFTKQYLSADKMYLTCTVSAAPKPAVFWRAPTLNESDYEVYNETETVFSKKNKSVAVTAVLQVSHPEKYLFANVTCYASVTQGQTSVTVQRETSLLPALPTLPPGLVSRAELVSLGFLMVAIAVGLLVLAVLCCDLWGCAKTKNPPKNKKNPY